MCLSARPAPSGLWLWALSALANLAARLLILVSRILLSTVRGALALCAGISMPEPASVWAQGEVMSRLGATNMEGLGFMMSQAKSTEDHQIVHAKVNFCLVRRGLVLMRGVFEIHSLTLKLLLRSSAS